MEKPHDSTRTLFVKTFTELNVTQASLTKIINAKEKITPSERSKMADKINGTRGISKADLSWIQLLKVLSYLDVDLETIEFDRNGVLTSFCKKNGDRHFL
jgi:hypothetical protein